MSRRALVIGSASFLGSWLCESLRASGWNVIGASRRRGAADLLVDLADLTSIQTALARGRPDVTFDLVAPARGAPFIEAIGLLQGTAALLQEAAGHVVLIGSAAEYGTRDEPSPISEDAPLCPRGSYAGFKAMQSVLARAIGHHTAVARLFNLTGPRQPRGFLASDLAARCLAGERPMRVRRAASTRDFIDVRDAASALVTIADGRFCGEVNVGCGVAVPISEVATTVCGVLGGEWSAEPGDQVDHSVADIGRLSALGWRPRHELAASLEEQARWAAATAAV